MNTNNGEQSQKTTGVRENQKCIHLQEQITEQDKQLTRTLNQLQIIKIFQAWKQKRKPQTETHDTEIYINKIKTYRDTQKAKSQIREKLTERGQLGGIQRKWYSRKILHESQQLQKSAEPNNMQPIWKYITKAKMHRNHKSPNKPSKNMITHPPRTKKN